MKVPEPIRKLNGIPTRAPVGGDAGGNAGGAVAAGVGGTLETDPDERVDARDVQAYGKRQSLPWRR